MAFELTIGYFMPIFAFLFVFVVIYALLARTKILGESTFVNLFLALVMAIIFIVVPAARSYTVALVPSIVVLIVVLFFILLVLGFAKGGIEDVIKNPALGVLAIIALILIFLISAIHVFSAALQPYMPWSNVSTTGATEEIKAVIWHPAVLGALILFIIAAVVAYVLNRFK